MDMAKAWGLGEGLMAGIHGYWLHFRLPKKKKEKKKGKKKKRKRKKRRNHTLTITFYKPLTLYIGLSTQNLIS